MENNREKEAHKCQRSMTNGIFYVPLKIKNQVVDWPPEFIDLFFGLVCVLCIRIYYPISLREYSLLMCLNDLLRRTKL